MATLRYRCCEKCGSIFLLTLKVCPKCRGLGPNGMVKEALKESLWEMFVNLFKSWLRKLN